MRKIVDTITIVLFMLALSLSAACVASERSAFSDNNISTNITNAFLNPEQAMLYSVQTYPDMDPETHTEKKDSSAVTFHGHAILGKAPLSAAQEIDAFKAIQTMAQKWNDASTRGIAMCFNPRHGIRVRNEGHDYDLLICYECAQVEVYKDVNKVTTLYIKTPPMDDYPKKLNEILKISTYSPSPPSPPPPLGVLPLPSR